MKQYLLLVDEDGMKTLSTIFSPNGIKFLEVQGLNMSENPKFQALLTPILPSIATVETLKLTAEHNDTSDDIMV